MRQTTKKQLPLTSVGIQHQHSKEFEAISRILDDAPELAERAQQDLLGGRRGDVGRKGMTGDQTIRVALLMQIHRLSYRALAFQLVDSSLFRRFSRLPFGKPVKISTLQFNVKRLSPETWEAINRALLKCAEAAGIESGRKSRTDCTVVESNIHEPSDSSLLWDCVRVVTRLIERAMELVPAADWSFFHDHRRPAKRRSFEIQFPPRSKGDKTKHRERAYRDLLKVAEQTQNYGLLADLKLANATACSVVEMLKIEALRSELRGYLESMKQDYHVGVITTDTGESGVLRPYRGAPVSGCDGCRYIDRAVPCSDPSSDETAMQEDVDLCPATSVFRDLVRVGIEGNALERRFEQTALALGLEVTDPKTGLPRVDEQTLRPIRTPPPENRGFIRDDADLMLIFVSDEDEGLGGIGAPVRYYERLLVLGKASGLGSRLMVAAIVGWPFFGEPDDPLPGTDGICEVLAPRFDRDPSNDEATKDRYEEGLGEMIGCRGAFGQRARTGHRYIELSCRLGGTIGNLCDADFRGSLEKLGDQAVRLGKQFTLTFASQLDRGEDCVLATADDPLVDCDRNGSVEDEIDGPICVRVVAPDGDARLIARDRVEGWELDPTSSSIVFPGDYEPRPKSTVEIRYWVVPGRSGCDEEHLGGEV